MPQVKRVLSLKTLCLESVARHMDRWSNNGVYTEIVDERDEREGVGQSTIGCLCEYIFVRVAEWFHYPALVGQVSSFVLSISLLGFYYKRLHPNLLLPNVGICTKNGPICLSDVQSPPIVNGVPSPRTSPARLGRLDIQQVQP